MKKEKLTTKIEFDFVEQNDMPEFTVDMKLKAHRFIKSKITEHKNKKKIIDSSTKLF